MITRLNDSLGRLGRSARVPAADPVLFFDTFTGADGTAINSRAPDIDVVGGGWLNLGGTNMLIQSNQCADNGNANGMVAQVGQADVRVSVDITSIGTALSIQIFFRRDNLGNRWQLDFRRTDGLVRLRENPTERASFFLGPLTVPFTPFIQAIGSSITFGVEGFATVGSFTSTSLLSETVHGIICNNNDDRWDNFKVEKI